MSHRLRINCGVAANSPSQLFAIQISVSLLPQRPVRMTFLRVLMRMVGTMMMRRQEHGEVSDHEEFERIPTMAHLLDTRFAHFPTNVS